MTDYREPRMHPQEFVDLQAEAGYPFVSAIKAHEYRIRRDLWNQIQKMMDAPRVSTRRVERD